MMPIEAISFDLWDTVIQDDSDEIVREERGLRSKREERRHFLWESVRSVSPVSYESVCGVYDAVDEEFNRTWHDEHVTWTFSERLTKMLDRLRVELPETKFREVVEHAERMEIDLPPKPVDGVAAALERLSSRYALVVVSDAIVTPGRMLREWLREFGMLDHFAGFAFSDEVGRSKPHPSMFESAAAQAGVDLSCMAHIGDREHNDIEGAKAMNMRAVLFAGVRSADAKRTAADAVCWNYEELPRILDRL